MYDIKGNGVLKTVESWSVTIPLFDNEGQAFDKTTINKILQEILLNYPGFSLSNIVGYWKGKEETYVDQNYQIIIDVIPDNTIESSNFFSELKRELQKCLSQEKIYITKQDSKQEFLSFDEFFTEIGVDAQSDNLKEEAENVVKQLVSNINFVQKRLGYETTTLRRIPEQRKIVWERKLCGIRLHSEFDDCLPEEINIIAADHFDELGKALISNEPFIIVGNYEYLSYVLNTVSNRSLTNVNKKLPINFNDYLYLSPNGEKLKTDRFIEEFTMSVFTNCLILRDEGFLPEEISVNVGSDGSMQLGKSNKGTILLHSPAAISEKEVQKETLRCLKEALHNYENNAVDEITILQAKAKNNYILKRAVVRHRLKNISV